MVRRTRLLFRRSSRLARWDLHTVMAPASAKLPPPPWRIGVEPVGGRVVARHDAPGEPIVSPRVYGSSFRPTTLSSLPSQTGPRTIALTAYDDIAMVGAGLFLSRERGTLLPHNFYKDELTSTSPSLLGVNASPPRFPSMERHSGPVYASDARWDAFGHILTEVIPSLALLNDAPPDSVVATSFRLSRTLLLLGEQMGVAPHRWRRIERPTLCKELYLPDMPIQLGGHIHPMGRDALDLMGRLGKKARLSEQPERIFLSRSRIGRRPLLNEAEVEALFARYGFAIVHPETLLIEEQIALIQGARMIAGIGGTAMHLAAFAKPDSRVLIVTSPVWIPTVDVHLNPVPGRLAYVLGSAGEIEAQWSLVPWQVDAAEVEAAIRDHFDI
jgi:hypothetical protein